MRKNTSAFICIILLGLTSCKDDTEMTASTRDRCAECNAAIDNLYENLPEFTCNPFNLEQDMDRLREDCVLEEHVQVIAGHSSDRCLHNPDAAAIICDGDGPVGLEIYAPPFSDIPIFIQRISPAPIVRIEAFVDDDENLFESYDIVELNGQFTAESMSNPNVNIHEGSSITFEGSTWDGTDWTFVTAQSITFTFARPDNWLNTRTVKFNGSEFEFLNW